MTAYNHFALVCWLAALPLATGVVQAAPPVSAQAAAFGVFEELRNLQLNENEPTEGPAEVKVIPLKAFQVEIPGATPTGNAVFLRETAPPAELQISRTRGDP